MSDISDLLKRLAGRGTERGAKDVFAAAQTDAQAEAKVVAFPARKLTVLTAVAASVMLVAGVAGAVRLAGNNDGPTPPKQFATGTTTTEPTSTTNVTAPAKPSSRVYLASTRLQSFNTCPTLGRYAQTKALSVVGPYGLPGNYGGRFSMLEDRATATAGAPNAGEGADKSSAAPAVSPGAADAYSTTNVQEAGIDEPDSVKTNGKTIFTVVNNKVFATSVGANPALVGSIEIQNARELLLVGNRLIVISDGGFYATDTRIASGPGSGASFAPAPSYPTASFTVVDVSDPAAMKRSGSFDVDGSYVSARLVDGVARIVVRSYPRMQFSYPQDGSPEAQAAATERNREVVRSATTDNWLPHFTVTNAGGDQIVSKTLATCGDSYRPPNFSGFGMLSVVSFNTANPADSHATSVMADGDIVYASPTRLYVATNSWGEVTASDVQPSASTLVHAFDISDSSNAKYLVSGRVRGTVLNQFAMSEHEGALRIATTDAAGGSESLLTVLGNSGDALVQIGQVSGLGRGERIYAVRFIDKVAYVVTFRQVDPLYVIDLSDPSHPRVVGELKITGYSAYLHPIGPGLLLGIGQEATTEGRRVGIAATVFDVSNPANPRVVSRKVLEQGSSSAEFDHHAFLYWPATHLTLLPIQTYSEQQPQQSFNGAVGLRIGEKSIDEVGRMQPPSNDMYGGSPGIQRTVVIGNRIYASSYTGVLVTTLDTLSQTAWVAYPTS
ncbi:MAG: hypothetical protein QOF21_436 [Actinomycetota bacterium]|jgi:hypothetical protein